jgi:organic hydroperoxide reductase OsmC/OhrA
MEVKAVVWNSREGHAVSVSSGANARTLEVPAKRGEVGSGVNGGEFLMLALATCYCNDLYREAARLGLQVDGVEVEASAAFDGIGLAARDVRYRARIASPEPRTAIHALMAATDAVAEVHNTLRAGVTVTRVLTD